MADALRLVVITKVIQIVTMAASPEEAAQQAKDHSDGKTVSKPTQAVAIENTVSANDALVVG